MVQRGVLVSLAIAFFTAPGLAGTLRIATYDCELERRGPGLLLADILGGKDAQVGAVAQVIEKADPDVLLLTGFDADSAGLALAAFADLLGENGADYPFRFSEMPNSGLETGLDMDGNGKTGEARDSQGYGAFTGAGGMAVLSRIPLGDARDFSSFLWSDLPGQIAPMRDGEPFPSRAVSEVRRLSSVAHWDVPVLSEAGPIHLLAFNATTPVFDGPEDLNGRRNHDEIAFWQRLLDGDLPFAPPPRPVVVIGNANLDPADGEGRHDAIAALLSDPRLQDPAPKSEGGRLAANPDQSSDPALDTVDWNDPVPGNLRVDYVLPDAKLTVSGAGVVWPSPAEPLAATVREASRHHLVWVDISLP